MEPSKKRKSTSDFDISDAETELKRRKLKALEAHADFGFKVGTEEESAEVNTTFIIN